MKKLLLICMLIGVTATLYAQDKYYEIRDETLYITSVKRVPLLKGEALAEMNSDQAQLLYEKGSLVVMDTLTEFHQLPLGFLVAEKTFRRKEFAIRPNGDGSYIVIPALITKQSKDVPNTLVISGLISIFASCLVWFAIVRWQNRQPELRRGDPLSLLLLIVVSLFFGSYLNSWLYPNMLAGLELSWTMFIIFLTMLFLQGTLFYVIKKACTPKEPVVEPLSF